MTSQSQEEKGHGIGDVNGILSDQHRRNMEYLCEGVSGIFKGTTGDVVVPPAAPVKSFGELLARWNGLSSEAMKFLATDIRTGSVDNIHFYAPVIAGILETNDEGVGAFVGIVAHTIHKSIAKLKDSDYEDDNKEAIRQLEVSSSLVDTMAKLASIVQASLEKNGVSFSEGLKLLDDDVVRGMACTVIDALSIYIDEVGFVEMLGRMGTVFSIVSMTESKTVQ